MLTCATRRNGRLFEHAGAKTRCSPGVTVGLHASFAAFKTNPDHAGDIKPLCFFNDQETGRSIVDARIGMAKAARESDLLAF